MSPANFDQTSTLTEFPSRPVSECGSPLASPRLRPKKVPTIPNDDSFEINLRDNYNEDTLRSKVFELVRQQIPSWKESKVDHIKLIHLSGAMTNCIYVVENTNPLIYKGPNKVLLRIYGVGVETFIEREKEITWLSKLSICKVGPRLLGTFHNGRLEEYLDSDTLTHYDIIDPNVSIHIAKRMSDLHNIALRYPPPKGTVAEIWKNIYKWLPIAEKDYQRLQHLMDKECYQIDFEDVKSKLNQLQEIIKTMNSNLMFCHNDAQYGNILRLKSNGELVVVDFEYAGYSYPAFDIANHFCEWMANYHSDRPHYLNENDYPNKSEQLNFLKAYLESQRGSFTTEELHEFQKEVECFSLLSHLKWGFWGIIQAGTSTIDFNYMAYGTQRLNFLNRYFEKYTREINH
ncbi:kinase-like protein [Neoconidiobolus thromboides FSU 785]|nr:kinase-like protein [Neoconidiobolus thromboides FSU 785]